MTITNERLEKLSAMEVGGYLDVQEIRDMARELLAARKVVKAATLIWNHFPDDASVYTGEDERMRQALSAYDAAVKE